MDNAKPTASAIIAETVESPGQHTQPASRLTFWQGFWLPVTHMLRPGRFGERFPDAPRGAVWASAAAGFVFLILSIACALIADAAIGAYDFRTSFKPFEAALYFVATLVFCVNYALVMFAVALLRFPDIHRAGSALRTASIAFWSSCQLAWMFGVVALAGGFVAIVVRAEELLPRGMDGEVILTGFGFAAVGAMFWLLVAWIRRFDRGLSTRLGAPELAVVCEGCGYQLVDVEVAGVCPECGQPVADSIVSNHARRPTRWEASRGISTWFQTLVDCVRRPSSFYGRLRLRDDGPAGRQYALATMVAMGLAVILWFLCFVVVDFLMGRSGFPEIVFYVLAIFSMLTMLITVVGWLWHRAVGAVAVLWVILHEPLRDGRWFSRVLDYETSFLWLHCAYSGSVITALVYSDEGFDAMLDELTGLRGLGGIPWSVVTLLGGNLAIGAGWLVRYARIVRAIRWNNF